MSGVLIPNLAEGKSYRRCNHCDDNGWVSLDQLREGEAERFAPCPMCQVGARVGVKSRYWIEHDRRQFSWGGGLTAEHRWCFGCESMYVPGGHDCHAVRAASAQAQVDAVREFARLVGRPEPENAPNIFGKLGEERKRFHPKQHDDDVEGVVRKSAPLVKRDEPVGVGS